MKVEKVMRTDLISGLVVSVVGTAGFVEALRMPRFEARNADPFTVPGLTPGIVCLVIAVLGVMLVLRALAGRGSAEPLPIGVWPEGSVKRTLFTIATVAVYGGALFGRIPFLAATALFVFVFTVGAEWLNPQRRMGLPALSAWALALSLVAAFVIHYVFTAVFHIRLPG
jgi:hypothetical protein